MSHRPVIALTAGDVAGVGPEILTKALNDPAVREACDALVLCHPDVLQRATQLGTNSSSSKVTALNALPGDRKSLENAFSDSKRSRSTEIVCYNPAGDAAVGAATNKVSADAGDAAFQYLTTAIQLAKSGVVDAITTAPLNKAALHAAGHHYPGHTEILAEFCGVREFAMMLHLPESRVAPLRTLIRKSADAARKTGHGLSVAHVTLHTSIESVPGLLTVTGVIQTIRLMNNFLSRIGCLRKAIAVCALNPHGGEGGLFGTGGIPDHRTGSQAIRLDRSERHWSIAGRYADPPSRDG